MGDTTVRLTNPLRDRVPVPFYNRLSTIGGSTIDHDMFDMFIRLFAYAIDRVLDGGGRVERRCDYCDQGLRSLHFDHGCYHKTACFSDDPHVTTTLTPATSEMETE